MSKEKRPAMPLYCRDVLADQFYIVMSLAERGAYMTLLMHCWMDRFVPDNSAKCARLVGCSEQEMEAVWPVIRKRFRKAKKLGYLIHKRVEEVRSACVIRQMRRVGAAKIGARKRWDDNKIRDNRISQTSLSSSSSSSSANDDVTWMGEALSDFMGGKWPAPDAEISAAAFQACNGASRTEIGDELVAIHRSGKRPGKSWAWFVTMLARRFQCRTV